MVETSSILEMAQGAIMEQVNMEVGKIVDNILVRLSEDGYVALYEADGGAWKLQARRNVADYLKTALADLIEAGEVIVVE